MENRRHHAGVEGLTDVRVIGDRLQDNVAKMDELPWHDSLEAAPTPGNRPPPHWAPAAKAAGAKVFSIPANHSPGTVAGARHPIHMGRERRPRRFRMRGGRRRAGFS